MALPCPCWVALTGTKHGKGPTRLACALCCATRRFVSPQLELPGPHDAPTHVSGPEDGLLLPLFAAALARRPAVSLRTLA